MLCSCLKCHGKLQIRINDITSYCIVVGVLCVCVVILCVFVVRTMCVLLFLL